MRSKRSKWLVAGWVLGGAIALVALVLTYAVVSSRLRMHRRYDVRVRDVPAASGALALAEGQRLFVSRGCSDCHGQHGEGHVVMDDAPARLVGPNLTEFARSARSIDFVRALRHGVARDGRPLVFMPSHEFQGLNDEELSRIIAFVFSLPHVESHLPEIQVRPLGNILHFFGLFTLLSAEHIDHTREPQSWPAREASVAYGKTLAVQCTGCHGEGLSGGAIPGAPAAMGVPANLTPHESGLRDWSEADFVHTLRTGVDPRGRRLNPKQMPWPTLGQMNDTELAALFAYLRTLPEKPAGGR